MFAKLHSHRRLRVSTGVLSAGAAALILCTGLVPALAAPKSAPASKAAAKGTAVKTPAKRTSAERESHAAADQLVHEALASEARGLADDRREQLQQALEQSPDHAPARWHLGHVQLKEAWVAVDDIPGQVSKDSRVAAYYKIRHKHHNTVDDQLNLANWCRERGLGDQERAHLTKVVELSSDHAEARARLGFRQVDGVWLSAEELQKSQFEAAALVKNLANWRPKIERIRQGLVHRAQARRARAEEQLLEIRDAAAIPAMETELATAGEDAALALVKALAAIADHAASLALARQAVAAPWPVAREAAVAQLKSRPEDAYIPALLSAMFTPVQSAVELYETPRGRLMYRHVFAREGQQANEVLVVENEYRRMKRGGDANDTLARALLDMNARFQTRQQMANQQNALTDELNSRIGDVLAAVTGQTAPQTPAEWWDWWNEHNEVFVSGSKATVQQYAQEEIKVYDRPTVVASSGGAMDCLAAGTRVWTSIGPVAIEKVRVGDLMLAQHCETGELAYKPVLRTTVRPPSKLVTMRAGYEKLTTSGGHPLWVSGKGWVRARNLQEGAELHGVHGPVMVDAVEKEGFDQTYNLVVADFHTYFVGEKKVLSHDNTVRRATTVVVPGLKDE